MGGIAVLAVREGLCLLRHFSVVATNTFMRLKKWVGLFQSFIFWCVHQWELHVITLSCFVCLFAGYTTTLFVSLGPVCHCGVPECETRQHDNVMEEWAWIPCHYTPLSS